MERKQETRKWEVYIIYDYQYKDPTNQNTYYELVNRLYYEFRRISSNFYNFYNITEFLYIQSFLSTNFYEFLRIFTNFYEFLRILANFYFSAETNVETHIDIET